MKTEIKLTGKVKAVPMQPALVGQTLAGIKTNTRRLMNPQPHPAVTQIRFDKQELDWFSSTPNIPVKDIWKPKHQPGDLLYITETHKIHWLSGGIVSVSYDEEHKAERIQVSDKTWQTLVVNYKLDFNRKRPARFMFRDFTRCVVLVEDVRPERLQDISEEDAIAEGIECYEPGTEWLEARFGFQLLWDSIHTTPGERWEDNPWVWRIQYRKVWQGSSLHLHLPELITSLQKELAV